MPASGTARCEFPGGSASALYRSILRRLALPAETRVFVCHEYQPNGRELAFEATIGTDKQEKVYAMDGNDECKFVSTWTARAALLSTPRLRLPSMQVNNCAGDPLIKPVSARPVITMPINALSDVDVKIFIKTDS